MSEKNYDRREFLKIYEKEMKERDLVPLPRDFYERVLMSLYRKEKHEGLRAEVKTLENNVIRKMLVEMFLCRMAKIIEMMISSKEINLKQLTNEEIEVFENISKVVNKLKRVEKKDILIDKVVPRNVLVIFTEPHPPFLASDKRMYGPFSKGDVAYLPVVDVSDLRRKGVVTIIKE